MCLGLSLTDNMMEIAGASKITVAPVWLYLSHPGQTKGEGPPSLGSKPFSKDPLTCGPFTFSDLSFLIWKKRGKTTLTPIGTSSWADQTGLCVRRSGNQTDVNT